MDYELYHDESLEGGYWHGMLLVPVLNKQEFSDLLQKARNTTRFFHKLGIKNVDSRGRIYDCASAWSQIGIACLRSKQGKEKLSVFLGKEKGKPIVADVDLLGMKFILFRERDSHKELNGYRDYASKVETTFRFGLKGGLHFLGSDENPISITKIHFDGHEHYQREIDKARIVNRIYGLREYCHIADSPDLIDQRRSDHNDPQSQDYEDCQFLQLTDILIGCFRTALGYRTRDIHFLLSLPIKKWLLSRYNQGYARMKPSRWFNSFVLSQCYLKGNGEWKFERVERKSNEEEQLALPFL
ncbi:MAG: hypothetical protein RBS45_03485 [Anaerolineales bacterium]|jgi:hypothetical protein|nr:hypothetical protein [Anaerolineales bacterium]